MVYNVRKVAFSVTNVTSPKRDTALVVQLLNDN